MYWVRRTQTEKGVNLMNDAIIVAILSFFGTALGTLKGMRLTSYRIEQLEKKVEKHNSIIERVYKLEEDMKNVLER